MSMERLSQQVSAYVGWKRGLMREITRYRSWLATNRLTNDAVEAKLDRALRTLRTDHITLAFVGEFSRGKTELINSLFFSEYGQRMLPSHAGRTTMCPTELFFDPRSERSYIRLLPIETRMTDASVAQFKRIPRHWVNIPLDISDPDNMVKWRRPNRCRLNKPFNWASTPTCWKAPANLARYWYRPGVTPSSTSITRCCARVCEFLIPRASTLWVASRN